LNDRIPVEVDLLLHLYFKASLGTAGVADESVLLTTFDDPSRARVLHVGLHRCFLLFPIKQHQHSSVLRYHFVGEAFEKVEVWRYLRVRGCDRRAFPFWAGTYSLSEGVIQEKHKQNVIGDVCSIPLISAGRNHSDLKQKHDILHIQSGYRDERTIVSRLAFSILADVDILHTILGGQSLLPDAFERTVDWRRWRLIRWCLGIHFINLHWRELFIYSRTCLLRLCKW
jgi:hypothetical protein